MKDIRHGFCPLCEHDEIVEGMPAEFSGVHGFEVQSAFAYDPRWVAPGRNPLQPHGKLSYYMCRRCGYLQWFVENPQEVPIGEDYRTRFVKSAKKSPPYR
jgi:hypothetical protein